MASSNLTIADFYRLDVLVFLVAKMNSNVILSFYASTRPRGLAAVCPFVRCSSSARSVTKLVNTIF